MGSSFESTGLAQSLFRFARVYVNTWKKELQHGIKWTESSSTLVREESGTRAPEETGAEEEVAFEMTPKRASVLVAIGVAVPTLIVWNHVGLFLDDVLFRGWRSQKVEKPVFIVGNARSGTTWMHRVLAQDRTNFTSPDLWEIMLAQSVTWRMLFHSLNKVDSWFGSPVVSTVSFVDKYFFGRTDVHPIGIWHPEEDEWFMMTISACQLSALILPLIDDFSELIFFDNSLKPQARMAIFGFYKSCLQKHLYVNKLMGKPPARYLSKNPTFTLRLQTIYDVFPDAEVVVMVRDPFHAVPSMVSYISRCWHFFASPCVQYPFNRALTEMCTLHYTYPVQVRNKMKRIVRQICFMHYELCTRDLVKSVSLLYRHLGLHITGSMAASLNVEAHISQSYQSRHQYNLLDTCGQTQEEFVEQHRKAFDLYPAYLRTSSI